MEYVARIIDRQLDAMMSVLPAICLEGAKGVGKTATAKRRTPVVFSLDDDETYEIVSGNPSVIGHGETTVFIDEWQYVPSVWNIVRHMVDDGVPPGRFLLAGSTKPRLSAGKDSGPLARMHSGAGRIVRLVMRPLSMPERGIEQPTVSLSELLTGDKPDIHGTTDVVVNDYVDEILMSGFPGIRASHPDGRRFLLRSYIDRIPDHDIGEMGEQVRRPQSLLNWLAAYGAATATTTSYSTLLNAATPGEDEKPSRPTAISYRDLLQRLWILDPLPAWTPGFGHLDRLALSPKHHFVDPALAAILVGATPETLIRGGQPPGINRDGTFLGALFESLAVATVRVLAEAAGAKTFHFRLQGGDHETDIIVERPDRRVLAIEVKLSTTVRPADVKDLNWLDEKITGLLVDKVILNTGTRAYRRPDGVAVIPLSLLGP